jgi:hypothetical protein
VSIGPEMQEAQILLAVLCDDVRHEVGGKVSLMGVFDTFNVAAYTAPLPPFHIFAKVGVLNEGTHAVTLRIRSEEGDFNSELAGQMVTQGLDEVTGRYVSNIDLAINGMTIPRPGRYQVAFEVDGRELAACGFIARTATPPKLN